jgi:hypothetical protein
MTVKAIFIAGKVRDQGAGAAQTSTGGFSSSRPMDFQTISAMSRAAMASSFLWSLMPSVSIVRQKGQPTAIRSAPVAIAWSVRMLLIRSPMSSSIHILAPPAPQQKP